MKRLFNTIVVSLVLGLGALSAQDYGNGLQLTGQLQMGLPQNTFADVFNGYPTGAGAAVLFNVGKSGLIRFGGEYGWNSLGEEKQVVEIIDEAGQIISGEMDFSSKIQKVHAIFRFDPLNGPIRPYFEVFAGMTYYDSSTELGYEQSNGTFITETRPAHRESANSYGYGFGLMIGLGKHIFLDGRVQIHRSSGVEFVDLKSLTIDPDLGVNYDIHEVQTDMIVPHAGLSIVF